MTPGDLFLRISNLLEHAGIPYMLTGSFASSIYGMHRGSADVHFIIAADQAGVTRLLNQLPGKDFYSDLNHALEACLRNSVFNAVDHVTGLKIDFIFIKSCEFSQEEFGRRKKATAWESRCTLLPQRISLSQNSSGQSSVNHRDKSKTQQEYSRFVLKSSTSPTSKNGYRNSGLQSSGRASAN